ncbi:Uncharacterised protein [Vibrio cholerae]|nr:Uncharacterised protein [Vibrio cholerae]CSB69599.1 Uncharacterised protein [Vibrio cholerae]CSB87624.1 Uncharacterised protein [Vibrio cholerae]CSI55948.1 Uncharacterised protein [Vibrio cholerae]
MRRRSFSHHHSHNFDKDSNCPHAQKRRSNDTHHWKRKHRAPLLVYR